MSKEKKYTIQQAAAHNTALAMVDIATQYHKKENQEIKKVVKYITNEQIIVPEKFTCSFCRKNKVKMLENPTFDEFKRNSTMCSGGTVQTIFIGYGSIHDMEAFVVTICDPCLTKLSRKKQIFKLP